MDNLGFFTPAKEQDIWTNGKEQPSSQPRSLHSGEEARLFYESLTKGNDGATQNESVCQREQTTRTSKKREEQGRGGDVRQAGITGERRGRNRGGSVPRREARGESNSSHTSSSGAIELQGLKLLRCAQEGDLSGMKQLFSKGVDINFQDSFFWTAIMCASWTGQRAAVRLLLQQGAAWVGVVDTQGRDARELALIAGHQGVLEELANYGRNSQQETQFDNSVPHPKWCDVCASQYSNSLSSHLSSTLHQFSLRQPAPTPYYCIPSSSASYKMMVRCGWNPGTGLGPKGGGTMKPVPTVLKRDQKGLGFGPQERARITHFLAKDPQAVKSTPKAGDGRLDRGKRKDESRRKEAKEKAWERDFRTSFYF
ncbi:G patch domain and ankyrin repeat-containing protein 1 [Lampris incognitus]|uniref:G patch domain and ankyrin repeat-containing protein 1 n=1 Tax=Lampris incognitus TaxID=2546036 RepID=UPI0024B563C7|nr:G patch domain and ankyrin repeat-containing protein 1 [Lampris incognitus]